MAIEAFKGEGFIVLEWPEFWLVRMEDNFGTKTAADLETALTTDPKLTGKNVPFIFNAITCERILPQEIRSFLSLKKKGINLAVVGSSAYVQSMKESGVENIIPYATSMKTATTLFGIRYKPKVDADLINPFLEGSIKVIGSQIGESLTADKAFLIKEPVPSELVGIIPLVSPIISGMIALEFTKETFLKIASKANGANYTELTPEIELYAAELTNMVYGSSRMKVNENGYSLQQTLPNILKGGNMGVATAARIAIGVPIKTSLGGFTLTIRIDT